MIPDFQSGNNGSRKILAVSPVSIYGGFNTSSHRIKALHELGYQVHVIDPTVREKPTPLMSFVHRIQGFAFQSGLSINQLDLSDINRKLLTDFHLYKPDIIWLDKALQITSETLCLIKKASHKTLIIGISLDDMGQRHNQSASFLSSLRHYDVFVTTKSYNVEELKSLGCRHVIFTDNGYDPDSFKPLIPTPQDRVRLGGDIGFIGTYEKQRALSLFALAKRGFSVRIWGSGGWSQCSLKHDNFNLEMRALLFDEFALACNSFKINLAFLRKINRDLQTTRSIEVPGCGGFMLAERTSEHQKLFNEGAEAEFFADDDELIAKCEFYLKHEELRQKIAAAGLRRCRESGYDWKSRLEIIFTKIDSIFKNESSPAQKAP